MLLTIFFSFCYRARLKCYNKIDSITIEQVDELARTPQTLVVSCEMDLNMDFLVETIWKNLRLLRVYTKKRGEYPDFEGGLIIRAGSTIEHVCHAIHRSLVAEFKYALVWGRSAKHNPQRVGLSHLVDNEDVVSFSFACKVLNYILDLVSPVVSPLQRSKRLSDSVLLSLSVYVMQIQVVKRR